MIKNLRVTGDIYTSKKYASGIVGTLYGEVKIINCRSSVAIHSSTDGDGTHGGFVGKNGNDTTTKLTIEGCVFDGSLLGSSTTSCGGLVGYRSNNGSASITNSLFAPSEVTISDTNCATFVRNMADNSVTNSFYTRALGEAQGKAKRTVEGDGYVSIDGIALTGDTTAYNVSGITAYKEGGLSCNGELYYGNKDKLSLTLSANRKGYIATGYTASAGTLSGTTLTMPDADVTVSATYEPDPAHFSYDGNNTYTIHTSTGWNVFCDMVEGGNTFEGKTVKLENSIAVSRMAGHDNSDSDNRPFSGTFDGQGKTLTLDYSGDVNYITPFPRAVGNAVFRDLKIDGVIESTGINAAGLIGHLYGNVTIERCSSSVEITSNGDSGGFVGRCEHSVSFTDCVSSAVTHSANGNNSGFVGWSRDSGYTISFKGCLFDGKILKKDGSGDSNGCFIGWTGYSKTVEIENCLCAPAALADGETMADGNSATFARRKDATAPTTITNCYYTAAFGEAQGARAYAVRAGDYTTVGFGTATNTYNVSGITGYANGIVYDGTFYSASGTSLNLTLGHAERENYEFTGYAASAGTLSGNALTMPANDVTVSAVYEITGLPYIDENGELQPCTQYTALTEEATTLTGWVVVAQDVNIVNTRLEVSGEARLILCDGVTLTAKKGIHLTGDNNSLTIYGQTKGTGKLYAGTTNGEDSTCDNSNAGIGGNSSQNGGKVTITGGVVTAKGGYSAAGIGGGNSTAGGEVTVNGGTVTAKGGDFGAGIGGGYWGAGGKVTITGGKVEATGYYSGAGIGGGYNKYNTGTLTVSFGNADDYLKASSYGGTVKVEAGYCVKYVDGNNTPHTFTGTLTDKQKSDIAGQELSGSMAVLHSVTIASTIANGTVTASKAVAAEGETVELNAAPATGYMLYSFSVQANGEAVTVTNNQFAMPGADVTVGAVFVAKPNVTYIGYANGTATNNTLNPTGYTILTADTATLTGWFVVLEDVNMGDTRLAVSGTAHLILCDGVTLTAKKGIHLTGDNNSLTIYGQTEGTGKLYAGTTKGEDATCEGDNAGIGGNSSQKGGALTINGGAVTAKGGYYGAGIGGGYNGAGGEVTITGGTVKANAGYDAAGIGGGCNGAGGEVTITGGTVTANGGQYGAGIGGGNQQYNTGTLTVSFGNADDYLKAGSYGGTVTAATALSDGSASYAKDATLNNDTIAGKTLRKDGTYFVSFDKNGGSGDMDTVRVDDGAYTLPACGFTAPEGMMFKAWSIDGTEYAVGESVTVQSDITATAVWQSADGAARLKLITTSFKDRLQLNFYYVLPQAVLDDDGAYLRVTKGGKSVDLPVKNANIIENDVDANKIGCYPFSYSIAAKEARDNVNVRLFYGDDTAVATTNSNGSRDMTDSGYDITAMTYLDYMTKHGSSGMQKLAWACKDYCTAAQLQFNYNLESIGEDDGVRTLVDAVKSSDLSAYASIKEGTKPDGIDMDIMTVMFDSDNSFRLYFKYGDGVEPTSYDYTVDGSPATLRQRADGKYYITKTGVPARLLHKPHTYAISKGGDTYTLTASMMTYAKAAIENGSTNMKTLAKAFYLYNLEAKAYFGDDD